MDVMSSRQETRIAHKMSINAAFHLVGQRSSRRPDQAPDFTLGVSPLRLLAHSSREFGYDCIDNAAEKAAAPAPGRWCCCVRRIFSSHASRYRERRNHQEMKLNDEVIALADKTDMSRAYSAQRSTRE